MSGRIRTIKPEWLDDEVLAATSSDARVLSVGLLLLADDYGNGRAAIGALAAEVWKFDMGRDDGVHATAVITRAREAMRELEAARYITVYTVDGQQYYSIRNWSKHQRVDKPGKPRVPGPTPHEKKKPAEAKRVAYFIRGATTGLVKIGESSDPVSRLTELAKTGSEMLELLAVGGVEAEHHRALCDDRVHGEWFRPSPAVLAKIREYGGDHERPIATAGYDGQSRVAKVHHENIREPVAKVPDSFAPDPDLRPTTATTTASVRAREDSPGQRENRVRSTVTAALVAAGRPAPPLDTSSRCQRIADWCQDHARATGAPFDDVLDRLSRGFAAAADAKTAKAGWPLAYLAQNPGQYITQAPSNPTLGGGETDAEMLASLRRTA